MDKLKRVSVPVGALVLGAALICSAQTAFAQEVPETWCTDQGQNIADARAISIGPRGNIYVTGGKRLNDHSEGKSLGSAMVTIKYDEVGRKLWSRSYQGAFGCYDNGSQLATDAAGNVYVAGLEFLRGFDDHSLPGPLPQVTGASDDPFAGLPQRAYVIVKYDGDGNRQWVSRFFEEGDNTNRVKGIAVDDRGDVYVTGSSVGAREQGGYERYGEIATVKYDGRTGEQLWARRYAGPSGGTIGASAADLAFDISKSNLYVAGTVCTRYTQLGNCEDYAYVVLNYDTSGALQWEAQYQDGPTLAGFAEAIAVGRSGDIHVTGRACDTPYRIFESGGNASGFCEKSSFATVKLNRKGDTVGTAFYHGEALDGAYQFTPSDVAVDSRGDVYVTGAGFSSQTYATEFHTVKYDTGGTQLWASVFQPGVFWGRGASIAFDSYGQAYVGGMVVTRSGYGRFAVVAYDDYGSERWSHVVSGKDPTRSWESAAIAVGKSGRVVTTGGTLDMLTDGLVDSAYLQNIFNEDGELLWTDER